MQLVRKYPLEIFLLFLFFYSFFASGWAGKTPGQQVLSIAVIVIFFIFFGLLRVAKLEYPGFLRFIISYLHTEKFKNYPRIKKYYITALLAFLLVILFGLLEVLVAVIAVGNERILAVGFPFPTYSFVSKRVLPVGIFLDVTIFSAFLLMFSYIKFSKKNN